MRCQRRENTSLDRSPENQKVQNLLRMKNVHGICFIANFVRKNNANQKIRLIKPVSTRL
jgi:hypothetical protein